MTQDQRRLWAETIVRSPPHPLQHTGLSYVEAATRVEALFNAAAQTGRWTYLAQHIALLHVEMLKRLSPPDS